jgi:hypothetical protein
VNWKIHVISLTAQSLSIRFMAIASYLSKTSEQFGGAIIHIS